MTSTAAGPLRAIALTAITMTFFAANSVLARAALREGLTDAGTFTAVRLLAGAVMLAVVIGLRRESMQAVQASGSWAPAVALVTYAIAFSYAYLSLEAGVGALILFAAVQLTMIGVGIIRGERPQAAEWLGLAVAVSGLVYLLSPGLAAPPLGGASVMALSGIAWGSYSLLGRGADSPALATASNFLRAAPIALALLLLVAVSVASRASSQGLQLAIISGAVTSGLGYILWYAALKGLTATRAAIVQLSVPVLAALGGVVFVGEQLTLRLAISAAAILGGVALALSATRQARSS